MRYYRFLGTEEGEISTESYHYKAEIKNTAKETRDNKGVYVGCGVI